MFTEDKITEIFCMADDFCTFFDETVQQYTLEDPNKPVKRPYHRSSTMSKAEVMVILILFHASGHRCLKHFYLDYVCKHMRHLFPHVVSYNRFVELEKDVLFLSGHLHKTGVAWRMYWHQFRGQHAIACM